MTTARPKDRPAKRATIVEAMDGIFRPWFPLTNDGTDTWSGWKAVLKAMDALPMTADEIEFFKSIAGGREPPTQRVSELTAVCVSNRIQVRPLFASKNDPSDGAETGVAEPHIAEQSRSWRDQQPVAPRCRQTDRHARGSTRAVARRTLDVRIAPDHLKASLTLMKGEFT